MEQSLQFLLGMSKTDYKVEVSRDVAGNVVLDTRNDRVLGYTIFDLLKVAHVTPEPLYNGQVTFSLSVDDVAHLNEHLNELKKWTLDFKNIIAELVGDEYVDEVVEVGQKPVQELVKGERRQTVGLSPHIREFLGNRYPDDKPFVLLNQLSLNLEKHPHRDAIKSKVEGLYRELGMKSANGKDKTFLKKECPYRSNLGFHQVKTICPSLNRVLRLKKTVDNFLGPNAFYDAVLINSVIPNGELGVLKETKIGNLVEIRKALMPQAGVMSQGGLIDEFSYPNTVDTIERLSKDKCESYLMERSSVVFPAYEQVAALTDAQIADCYGGEENRLAVYPGGHQLVNVSGLMSGLRHSAMYQAVVRDNPDLDASMRQLENEVLAVLDRYDSRTEDNRYYGRNLVREGLGYLEQFVAKVVNAQQQQLTPTSVENALLKLTASTGGDLTENCTRGFAGRMQEPLLTLVSAQGSELDAALSELRHQCAEKAFVDCYGVSSESSMNVDAKENLMKAIGIVPSEGRRPAAEQFMLRSYNRHYNPVSVYYCAYDHVRDQFWQHNSEAGNDNAMYEFLESFGFGSDRAELDTKYRVCGDPAKPWQYANFQEDLPLKIIQHLIGKGALTASDQGSARQYIQASAEIGAAGLTPVLTQDTHRTGYYAPDRRTTNAAAPARTERSALDRMREQLGQRTQTRFRDSDYSDSYNTRSSG